MRKRKTGALSNRKFVRALYEHYDGAKKCVCCEDPIQTPNWHHILPVALGGKDIITNMVPVCDACHKAIHNMKPAWYYKFKAGPSGGRPIDRPENCENIFEDYVRCRISKSEAAERLGKSLHFIECKAFIEYKFNHSIAKYKNNIDIYLKCAGRKDVNAIEDGRVVGSILYEDGTTEELYWGKEEPLTGKSRVGIIREKKKLKFW